MTTDDALDSAYLKALDAWRVRHDPRALRAWFSRNLDPDGIPRRLPVRAWWPLLRMLSEVAPQSHDDAFEAIEAEVEGFVRAALRFSRPDGAAVFSEEHRPEGRGRLLADWSKRLADVNVETVARWWFPESFRPRRFASPPLLPAYCASDATGPLAVLRADWLARGDFVAIDQRQGPTPGLVELVGGGTRWLGPHWELGEGAGRSRMTFWSSTPSADCAEWTFRRARAKVTRLAVFFRSRKLALLSEQIDGAVEAPSLRLQVAPNVQAAIAKGRREARLTAGRSSCAVLPIGLPEESFPTALGSLAPDSGHLVLKQRGEARRAWLPLLMNWDATRNRLPVHWRRLTVSENSKVCRPGTACAYRVWWGNQRESLLIYRSLGPPALRAFLGHQTRSRIVIGRFDQDGNVEPFLKVD